MSFEWPCDRRDAHGPHPRPIDPEIAAVYDVPPDQLDTIDPEVVGLVTPPDCPGVKAHPATMIGRQA